MCRRPVNLAVEFGITRPVLLEHIVDSGVQHPGNGDNRFLVSPVFLERKVTAADFWESLGPDSTKSSLN